MARRSLVPKRGSNSTVLSVDKNFMGFETDALLLFKFSVGGNDDQVAFVNFSCGCSIEADLTWAAIDDVSIESLSVVDVVDLHSLVRNEMGRITKGWVNGDRTFIVEVGSSNSCSVDLTFHQSAAHAVGSSIDSDSLAMGSIEEVPVLGVLLDGMRISRDGAVSMATQSFFSTLIHRAKMPSGRFADLKKRLMHEIRVMQEIDEEGIRWSKKNYPEGYTSYSSMADLPLRSSNFAELRAWLDRQVKAYVKALGYDLQGGSLEMTSCWVNVMGKGAHHAYHIHPLSVVSGTFYLEVPKGGAGFKIEDPRMGRFMAMPPRLGSVPQNLRPYVDLQPSTGEVLLFESWLNHEVPTHRVNRPRVSISFNYEWSRC